MENTGRGYRHRGGYERQRSAEQAAQEAADLRAARPEGDAPRPLSPEAYSPYGGRARRLRPRQRPNASQADRAGTSLQPTQSAPQPEIEARPSAGWLIQWNLQSAQAATEAQTGPRAEAEAGLSAVRLIQRRRTTQTTVRNAPETQMRSEPSRRQRPITEPAQTASQTGTETRLSAQRSVQRSSETVRMAVEAQTRTETRLERWRQSQETARETEAEATTLSGQPLITMEQAMQTQGGLFAEAGAGEPVGTAATNLNAPLVTIQQAMQTQGGLFSEGNAGDQVETAPTQAELDAEKKRKSKLKLKRKKQVIEELCTNNTEVKKLLLNWRQKGASGTSAGMIAAIRNLFNILDTIKDLDTPATAEITDDRLYSDIAAISMGRGVPPYTPPAADHYDDPHLLAYNREFIRTDKPYIEETYTRLLDTAFKIDNIMAENAKKDKKNEALKELDDNLNKTFHISMQIITLKKYQALKDIFQGIDDQVESEETPPPASPNTNLEQAPQARPPQTEGDANEAPRRNVLQRAFTLFGAGRTAGQIRSEPPSPNQRIRLPRLFQRRGATPPGRTVGIPRPLTPGPNRGRGGNENREPSSTR